MAGGDRLREGWAMKRPKELMFFGHPLTRDEDGWYTASAAAWGAVCVRPVYPEWVAEWDGWKMAAREFGRTPTAALAKLCGTIREARDEMNAAMGGEHAR